MKYPFVDARAMMLGFLIRKKALNIKEAQAKSLYKINEMIKNCSYKNSLEYNFLNKIKYEI